MGGRGRAVGGGSVTEDSSVTEPKSFDFTQMTLEDFGKNIDTIYGFNEQQNNEEKPLSSSINESPVDNSLRDYIGVSGWSDTTLDNMSRVYGESEVDNPGFLKAKEVVRQEYIRRNGKDPWED
ncbi:MAG: hypothetical protein D3920_00825 [Candidatus Electrothrix sp. AW2]|nr:hypothetical protein [Candidatus Electrothrix gigas]